MANFKTHLVGAAAVSAVLSNGLAYSEVIGTSDALGLFSTAVVGGLLPDIDLGHSVPVNLARKLMAAFGIIVVTLQLTKVYSTFEIAIAALGMYVAVQIFFKLFDKYTKHRGLFHSIPAGVLCALAFGVLLDNFSANSDVIVWFYTTFLFIGFIIHLTLDELYSVNLLGASFKRSFGTALKLGERKNAVGTAAMYLACLGLYFLTPPTGDFLSVLADSSTYSTMLNNLWPSGQWFKSLD